LGAGLMKPIQEEAEPLVLEVEGVPLVGERPREDSKPEKPFRQVAKYALIAFLLLYGIPELLEHTIGLAERHIQLIVFVSSIYTLAFASPRTKKLVLSIFTCLVLIMGSYEWLAPTCWETLGTRHGFPVRDALPSTSTWTPQGCQAECAAVPACKYFWWTQGGACHLVDQNNSAAAPGFASVTISGPATCSSSAPLVGGATATIRDAHDLWLIDGSYYDLEPLVAWHPGTERPLRHSRGTDATTVFAAQHLRDVPREHLVKYAVPGGRVRGSIPPAPQHFSYHPEGFYMTLRKRVREHLAANHVEKPRMVGPFVAAKLFVNVGIFFGTWAKLVLSPWSRWTLPLCAINSLSRMVLTGLAHEAVHGNVFPYHPTVQRGFVKMFMEGFVGFSGDKWFNEHALLHHPFTKTSVDPDENLNQAMPFLRLTVETPWTEQHQWPLTFKSLVGALLPIGNFYGRRCQATPMASMLYLHLLPLFFHRPRAGFAIVAAASMSASVITIFAFHTTHLLESTERVPYKPGVDWGAHQLHTTANWESTPLSLSGGLDLQIEHHLFPYLAYDKQQMIKPIVEKTAYDFGLPYHSFEHGAVFAAYWHAIHMAALGSNSPPPRTVSHFNLGEHLGEHGHHVHPNASHGHAH